MIIKPRIRGFVCITSHPKGCAAKVRQEIDVAQAAKKDGGPKKVLVLGSSTGYGLSSRIATAFCHDAATLGVFFERPSMKGKPASSQGKYGSSHFAWMISLLLSLITCTSFALKASAKVCASITRLRSLYSLLEFNSGPKYKPTRDLLWKTWFFSLLTRIRALIRKFQIKGSF